MRYSLVIAPFALAASVSAGEDATTSIEVVSTLTTYCSSATSLSINGKLHTVTEATTMTITECPCTITHSLVASSAATTPSAIPTPPAAPIVTPILSSTPSPIEAATISTPIAPAIILSTAPAAAPPSSAALPPYPVSNSTAPIPTLGTASAAGTTASLSAALSVSSLGPASTGVTTPAAKTPFMGMGDKVAASSVSLVALVGLAAYLL